MTTPEAESLKPEARFAMPTAQGRRMWLALSPGGGNAVTIRFAKQSRIDTAKRFIPPPNSYFSDLC